jgi:hypothetical protein
VKLRRPSDAKTIRKVSRPVNGRSEKQKLVDARAKRAPATIPSRPAGGANNRRDALCQR